MATRSLTIVSPLENKFISSRHRVISSIYDRKNVYVGNVSEIMLRMPFNPFTLKIRGENWPYNHLSSEHIKAYEKPSSPYCLMWYFWSGCRRNFRFITLGSERGKQAYNGWSRRKCRVNKWTVEHLLAHWKRLTLFIKEMMIRRKRSKCSLISLICVSSTWIIVVANQRTRSTYGSKGQACCVGARCVPVFRLRAVPGFSLHNQ